MTAKSDPFQDPKFRRDAATFLAYGKQNGGCLPDPDGTMVVMCRENVGILRIYDPWDELLATISIRAELTDEIMSHLRWGAHKLVPEEAERFQQWRTLFLDMAEQIRLALPAVAEPVA